MQRIILFTLIQCLFFSIPAFANPTPIGTIIAISGEITASSNGDTRLLSLATPVFPKDLISTGLEGKAQIMFTDDTVISIGSETKVSIDEYTFDEQSSAFHATCTKGMVEFATGEIGSGDSNGFQLKTPVSTVNVGGEAGKDTGNIFGGVIVEEQSPAGQPAGKLSSAGKVSRPITGAVLLFYAENPSSVEVTNAGDGETTRFTDPNQMIRQQPNQKAEKPEPVTAVVLAEFREGTGMPATAFGPGYGEAPKSSGKDGGKAIVAVGPTPNPDGGGDTGGDEPPTVIEITTGGQLDDEIKKIEHTNTGPVGPGRTTDYITPKEDQGYIYTAATIYDNANHEQGVLRTSYATEMGKDITLYDYSPESDAKLVIAGADPYTNFSHITSGDSSIDEAVSGPIGVLNRQVLRDNGRFSWGYWEHTAPVIQGDSGGAFLDAERIMFVDGKINTSLDNISGFYSGGVKTSVLEEGGAIRYSSAGSVTARVELAGGIASVTDFDMLAGFDELAIQIEDMTGVIQDGQFVLGGGTTKLENLSTAQNIATTDDVDVRGALFEGKALGGTFNAKFEKTAETPNLAATTTMSGVFATTWDMP